MKNKEKYIDEILDQGRSVMWCRGFVQPKILNYYGLKCRTETNNPLDVYCTQCQALQALWLDDECKEE